MRSPIRDEYNANADAVDVATASLKDLANWRYISDADWTTLCRASADFARVRDGDVVFEAGCGAGGFLAELLAYRDVIVHGVDFAENLVAVARARVVGTFAVADIRDLARVPSARFDRVVSHGVFLYLASVDDGARAVAEMLRIAKPGGSVYVGIVNDPDRSALAAEYEHAPSGAFTFTRDWWRAIADAAGAEIEIVDQARIFSRAAGYDGYSRLRYSLVMRTRA